MNLAILGATSQIAKDFVCSVWKNEFCEVELYARDPGLVRQWLKKMNISSSCSVFDFEAFGQSSHDAVLNCVGIGDPARAAAMGNSIFSVTALFDDMALNYVKKNAGCKYLFLSSGAVYGRNFCQELSEMSSMTIPVNDLSPQDYYSVAKLHAECKHRSYSKLPIVDVRVFNYFSHTQDMSARFFITDAMRALRSGEIFITSQDNIVRDYLGAEDFYNLIISILKSPPQNDVVDCYTLRPVDKFTLLVSLEERFGLRYSVVERDTLATNATGFKLNYFSLNRRANNFGYTPKNTALDVVLQETEKYLELTSN